MFIKKRGQTFQEYVILLALVAAALIAMQTYMKRGVQGRLRDLADQISPKQYEPIDTVSTTNITRNSNSLDKASLGTYTVVGSDKVVTDYTSNTVEQ